MVPDILKDLSQRLDHAALKPETTESDIASLCRNAREHSIYAVAINPVWVRLAREELIDSPIKIVSVCGFPLGANRTEIKIAEAVRAVSDGAHEIDMVVNISCLLTDSFTKAEHEIKSVRDNLPYNIVLKVIIEASKLTAAQQTDATKAVLNGGAQFVKTGTGFFGGATVDQVRTLSIAADGKIEVKASGSIRSLEQCRLLLEAGATRLGTSSSVELLKELAAYKD